MPLKRQPIADEDEVRSLVDRLVDEIGRKDRRVKDLAFVGIRRRGVPLAYRLAESLGRKRGDAIPVGAIDITLYRDDLQLVAETPVVRGSEIGFDINARTIVLVDDVIYTGRTVRAALTELLDFGRPRCIQLAILIDRGHRELPIEPNFVGKKTKTRRDDLVDICLVEEDGRDGVVLTRR